jgi:phosphoglycolate phosphatase-like HAD superfamily hydrolase
MLDLLKSIEKNRLRVGEADGNGSSSSTSGGVLKYGALSNACGAYVRAVLKANGVAEMFTAALGADEVPAAKPAPDGLLQCCAVMGLVPARCLYIGDSPTDGQAAAAAGMRSIGVTWGSHPADLVRQAFTVTADDVPQLQADILQLLEEIDRECTLLTPS